MKYYLAIEDDSDTVVLTEAKSNRFKVWFTGLLLRSSVERVTLVACVDGFHYHRDMDRYGRLGPSYD